MPNGLGHLRSRNFTIPPRILVPPRARAQSPQPATGYMPGVGTFQASAVDACAVCPHSAGQARPTVRAIVRPVTATPPRPPPPPPAAPPPLPAPPAGAQLGQVFTHPDGSQWLVIEDPNYPGHLGLRATTSDALVGVSIPVTPAPPPAAPLRPLPPAGPPPPIQILGNTVYPIEVSPGNWIYPPALPGTRAPSTSTPPELAPPEPIGPSPGVVPASEQVFPILAPPPAEELEPETVVPSEPELPPGGAAAPWYRTTGFVVGASAVGLLAIGTGIYFAVRPKRRTHRR